MAAFLFKRVVRFFAIGLVIIGLLQLSGCNKPKETATVSEAPRLIEQLPQTQVTARPSKIGLRAKVAFADFAQIIRQQVPAVQNGSGRERKCKRVLGIKVCGTAEWQFTVYRGDNISVAGEQDRIKFSLPISFDGVAGMQGDVAKALGLSKLNFSGALDATVSVGLDLDSQWCPVISTNVVYNWTQTPKVQWAGGLDLNIKKYLDDEIAKQLADLPEDIEESIDCAEFRAELSKHWRSYSFELDVSEQGLKETQALYLNLVPEGFAFSGIKTDHAHIGMTFVLEASTTVQSSPVEMTALELPELTDINFESGKTVFELLLRADYAHLTALAEPELLGRTFTSETAVGTTSVTVKSVRIDGASTGLTITIEFDSDLPATRSNTPGIVYLTALPVIDSFNQVVSLEKIQLTKILDNKLWDSLATVFKSNIIESIQNNATVDIKPRIKELETQLLEQLSEPANTAGLEILTDNITAGIVNIHPEQDALAIVLQVSASVDMRIPLSLLKIP